MDRFAGLASSYFPPAKCVASFAATGRRGPSVSNTASGRSDLASARASLGVGIAVGVGPFLLGALADAFGTHNAFLVVPGFLALAALCVRRSAVRPVVRSAER